MQVFLPDRSPDEDREGYRQRYPRERDPGNPPHTSSMPAPGRVPKGVGCAAVRGDWSVAEIRKNYLVIAGLP